MKLRLVAALLCVSLFTFANKIYALKEPKFIEHISRIICEDCEGADINIKKGFLTYRDSNQEVTVLRWPYDDRQIDRIIELFVQGEPYNRYAFNKKGSGVSMGASKTADKILTCKNHVLDINYDDYYWDGIKVELPRQNIDVDISAASGGKATLSGDIVELSGDARYAKTEGSSSPATVGDNSPITQNNFFVKLFTNIYFNVSISFVLCFSLVFNFMMSRKLKRKIKNNT